MSFSLGDLEYNLPKELIAQEPLEKRDASRLLVLGRDTGKIAHHTIRELPSLLPPSLFVFNDTRVLAARLHGKKSSGANIELLLLEKLSREETKETWLALGRPGRRLHAHTEIICEPDRLFVTVRRWHNDGTFEVTLDCDEPLENRLEHIGSVPLPPYIHRAPKDADRERYQTVFASHLGAVAAPTAGLHFSQLLIQALTDAQHELAYVTLHVGPGTFAPLEPKNFETQRLHEERFYISEATVSAIKKARAEKRLIVAVGTTVMRTLESSIQKHGELQAGSGRTSLFIYPPYTFRSVDALLTNFHVPGSSLLALVMAFASVEHIRQAYETAITERYRFLSYGDAMLIGNL